MPLQVSVFINVQMKHTFNLFTCILIIIFAKLFMNI